MPYRIEDSPNARAGCTNSECNKAKVKIQKGELRFATQVTLEEHTSWKYRHWGCVTPAVIQNWKEENEGDPEMIDGYDALSSESKEKVDFALENGHVPDEDWKGDPECNRPGQKGFRLTKAARKKLGLKAAEDDEETEAPKAKAKRGRAKKEDDEDEAPVPKKARGKGKKAADEDDAAEKVVAPKPKRGKKAAANDEVEEDDAEEPEPPKAKRGKKAAPKKDVDDDDAAEEPEPPKAKRGKKAAAADDGEQKAAPQKRSGRKKAAVNYEEE